ncbi:MAG: bifunctional diaminohydroxyphosphoribosylaminopyrimidine deaminase/5-amino-6-(5-phosphoribosylamino)uracil reductase RibD [Chitinophagaceae bacterium]|nr:bifunctional diaminohydroxyphosphoribosylaminopyrimidine deaminase/5-amino-6-(5-phosphoribosylamino)uracil reductase RibD [Chitinophagaceae bacterium]
MTKADERYMRRCIELALLGSGYTAPNPLVGAVLVHENRIIGEGYHEKFGEAHAEVNCINSVQPADRSLISRSTLFVSLEPCAHYGKTPPCTDLIIRENIPHIVIGCRDPFEKVNGKGIEKLVQAGRKVNTGILEKECGELNKRFFTFHRRHRPYIILKWAQTADGFIGSSKGSERLRITNNTTNRLVHRWRSEEAAILVGTNTALQDDPSLNTRLWTGRSPVRLVLDRSLRLPVSLKLFNGEQPTVIFNERESRQDGQLRYYLLDGQTDLVTQIVKGCYQLQLQSLIVEGGAVLLNSFIASDIWDEARLITNNKMNATGGTIAPSLINARNYATENLGDDTIQYYFNEQLK